MALTENPFKSSRLIYRAIESPADDEFFFALQDDPFSMDTSSPGVISPMDQERCNKIRKSYQESVLGVMICLPTTDENLALAGGLFKKEDLLKPNLVRDQPIDKGIPIGAMCLDREAPGPKYIHNLKGTIGLDIAPRYQSKGYGREALEWLLDWGFTHARFHRIAIRVVGWNPRALRLYQRIGFKLESHERETWWRNGGWQDDYGLALLDYEWKEIRASKQVAVENLVVSTDTNP